MTTNSIDERFDCQKVLGEGAFAIVYRALDNKTGKTVALKVLKNQSTQELKRFRREGNVLSTVKHPNIIKIYELQLEEPPAFLTMEYLQGKSLAQLLEKEELPIKKVFKIIRQLAKALGHLHKLSIYHRDVKPENVMVVKDRVVLMDFNLALPSKGTMLTATGELLGTPRYIAPEIWYGAESKENADIYALGVVFYELLAGREAHLLASFTVPGEVKDMPPPSDFNEQISTELDEFVLKCMAHERSKRFQSMDELLVALEKCPLASTKEKKPKKKARPFSLRPLVPLLFLLALALAYFSTKSQNEVLNSGPQKSLKLALCPFVDGFYCQFPITGLSQAPKWQLWGGQTLLAEGQCTRQGNSYIADGKVKSTKANTWLFKLISQNGKLLDERAVFRAKSNLSSALECRIGARKLKANWQLNGDVITVCKMRWLPLDKEETIRCQQQELTVRAPKGTTKFQISGRVGSRTLFTSKGIFGVTQRFKAIKFSSLSHRTVTVVENSLLCLPQKLNRLAAFSPKATPRGTTLHKEWEAPFRDSKFCEYPLVADKVGGSLAYVYNGGKVNLLRLDIRSRLKDKSKAQKPFGRLDSEWMVQIEAQHPRQTLVESTRKGDFYIGEVNAEGLVEVHHLSANGLLKKLTFKEQEPYFILASALWRDQFVLLGVHRKRLLLYFFFNNEMHYLHLDEARTNKLPARLAVLSPYKLLVHIGNRLFLVESDDAGQLSYRALPKLPAVKPWEISEALLAENGSLTFVNVRPGISSKNAPQTMRRRKSFQVAGEVVRNTLLLTERSPKFQSSVIGRSVIFNDRTLRVFSHLEHKGLLIQPAFESIYVFSKETGKLIDKIRLFMANADIYIIGDTLFFAPNKDGIRAIDLVDYDRR